MGIETEYGVLQPGQPMANPMLMSSQVVTTYRALAARSDGARGRARWDYDDEDPLQDARGFHLQRASAHPSLLTDDPTAPAPSGPVAASAGAGGAGGAVAGAGAEGAGTAGRPAGTLQEVARPTAEEYDDPSAANVILTNGARLYVDHAHPEYSSPEVTVPHDAVCWDVAGERVMLAASRELANAPGAAPVVLYKNNVDGKGASYGTHENYLVDRDVPFGVLVEMLTPFLVTRQVFSGSGRVGLGPTGEADGYQISQRADYVEAEVGLETTLRRPIVNTRDEPHADRLRWRRLHLIIGDANLFETATYLKTGTTSLVLFVIEHLDELGPGVRARLASLRLADPVADVQRVSRDLDLTRPLRLADGRSLTALEIQREYLAVAADAAGGPAAGSAGVDAPTRDVLDRWESVLTRLASDRDACARDVEWVAKLRLLDRLRERDGLDWGHARLATLDLQWSDVRPERGIYHRLLAAGAVDRIVTEREVGAAVHHAPEDTRAFFRGEVMARYGDQVSAASWDSVIFDVPGAPSLQRVPMMDPLRGTRAHIGSLLDASDDAATLLAGLASPS
ncbi:depupylase/deamidase Dop [Cellulosimicrobium arenosum]|uniref:Proteasome accessory factor PafA2 n=1 Tax=Cellulosimicrobium arenosum TaxID=2708133 RepID=A0A927G662_9MICO|nr:depupylase/deamidase Dop [Cellulosimicrobium arenosum]MBD8077657.1 proteasome accessory factor PafA2 [Cellulosimicrobium arenosum]